MGKITQIGIILLFFLVIFLLVEIVGNINKSNDCVIKSPQTCKFYCSSNGKNVTDLFMNYNKLIEYREVFGCEVLFCEENVTKYEIINCDLEEEKWFEGVGKIMLNY